MVKLEICDKPLYEYVRRAVLTSDGLNQKDRLLLVCGGETSLFFKIWSNNFTCVVDWIAVDESNISYFAKLSLPKIEDSSSFVKDAYSMPGFDFIGVALKDGNFLACPMSEQYKLEHLVTSNSI